MTSIEQIFVAVTGVLILSVIASKGSEKFGIPALLLFLFIGMLAGSEGPGGVHFDDAWLAQALGVTALAFILFAGGMDTRWSDVRPVGARAFALSTIGVAVTSGIVGVTATHALGFSLLEGLLLGSIISSTDAAAVFSVLRSRNIGLPDRVKHLLEFESGSNDPMAVFLTVAFITLVTQETNPAALFTRMFSVVGRSSQCRSNFQPGVFYRDHIGSFSGHVHSSARRRAAGSTQPSHHTGIAENAVHTAPVRNATVIAAHTRDADSNVIISISLTTKPKEAGALRTRGDFLQMLKIAALAY